MRVRAFPAVRPLPDLAAAVSCAPYDVVNRQEARRIIEREPRSFMRVLRPDADPDCRPDASPHHCAARAFQRLLKERVLLRDDVRKYYLYRLEQEGRAQIGVAVTVHAEEYRLKRVRTHELVRDEPLHDRRRHIAAVGAHTGPVLCFARSLPMLEDFDPPDASDALYDFGDEKGVRHTVWAAGGCHADLHSSLDDLGCIYVADGHHRMAAAVAVAEARREQGGSDEAQWILCVIFPASQMRVLPYHRVVSELGMPASDFQRILQEDLGAERVPRGFSAASGEAAVYVAGYWYRLPLGPRHGNRSGGTVLTDTEVLQERVLGPILQIGDPRSDPRITFVGGKAAEERVVELVDGGKAAAGFLLRPVDIVTIMRLADRGGHMPPKSTWFEPKLRSGLLVHPIQ